MHRRTISSHNNGSSNFLRQSALLLCTFIIILIDLCAASPHYAQRADKLRTIDDRASDAVLTLPRDVILTTPDPRGDTFARSTSSLNSTAPKPRIMKAYAFLIPSQAHADLLNKVFSEVRAAAIEALEAAVAPMKLTITIGAIAFHIWLLSIRPGIIKMLYAIFEVWWLMASPLSLMAVQLFTSGCFWIWIELGGTVRPEALR